MRFIELVFVYTLLMINFSCTQKKGETKVICITYDYGDGQWSTLIGLDNRSIDSSYQGDKSLKEAIEEINGADKHVVKPEALKYISQYVDKNCGAIDTITIPKVPDFYTVRSFSKDGVRKCYYYNRDIIKSYLNGMILWINESPYKEECKSILEQLHRFVDPMG